MGLQKTIPQLPNSNSLDGTELIELSQGGKSVKSLLSAFLTYISSVFTGGASITTVGTIATGVWSGKFAPRVNTTSSASTVSVSPVNCDIHTITALAVTCTIDIKVTPTPNANQEIIVRIKDNGTSKNLVFDPTTIRFLGVSAPAATISGQTVYLIFKYNLTNNIWDCILCTDAIGGGSTPITSGIIPVGTGTGITDSTYLQSDETNKRLGINQTPTSPLDVNGVMTLRASSLIWAELMTSGINNWEIYGDSTNLRFYNYAGTKEIVFESGRIGIGISPIAGSALSVGGTQDFVNQYSTGATPAITAGAAAGTSPTVSVVGTNKSGVVTITTGTGVSLPTGTLVSLVFSASFAFPNGCAITITPQTSGTIGVLAVTYAVGITTGFSLNAGLSSTYLASTTYKFNYIVEGY